MRTSAKDSSDLGKSALSEHAIDTGDSKPVKQPPRRVPTYQQEVIDQQLDKLLATGRVEPSQSPWSTPVVLVRKHDRTYRMCIDLRKLNQSTKKDAILWVGLSGFLAWIWLQGTGRCKSKKRIGLKQRSNSSWTVSVDSHSLCTDKWAS